jgi:hypothetical protein
MLSKQTHLLLLNTSFCGVSDVLILADILFASELFNDSASDSNRIAWKDRMALNKVLWKMWKETVKPCSVKR